MDVVEIFKSIEGEGKRTGLPTTFVRLWGCPLKCSYCDTRYACEGTDYKEMSVTQIIDKVKDLGLNRVTLTGGEPLFQLGLDTLLAEMFKAIPKLEVNIETNGAESILLLEDPKLQGKNIFVTMDWKCPSSGMNAEMDYSNLYYLNDEDVLKFVVGSTEDLEEMSKIIKDLEADCQVYASPIFGQIEPKQIVEYILENDLKNVHVQVQLHKVIWDPNTRGV